jgi:hypothetical protein
VREVIPPVVEPDFWSTSAQTMPVLALAVVVEARATMAKWESGKGALWKAIQGFLWGIPLLFYGVATPMCLRALAGVEIGGFWVQAIPLAIFLGVVSLAIVPAGNLIVKANARPLAHVFFGLPILGFRSQFSRATSRMRFLRRELNQKVAAADRFEISIRSSRHRAEQLAGSVGLPADVAIAFEEALAAAKESRQQSKELLEELDASMNSFHLRFLGAREEIIKRAEDVIAGRATSNALESPEDGSQD